MRLIDRILNDILEHRQRYAVIWCVLVILNLFLLLYMSVYFLENLFQLSDITKSFVLFFAAHMVLLVILVLLAVYDRRVFYEKRLAMQKERALEQIEKNQVYQMQLQQKAMLVQQEEVEFNKHIANIATMTSEEKTEEIAAYINALKPVSIEKEVQRFTGNAILDLMFNEKLRIANRKQIELAIDYQPNAHVHCLSEYDMSLLLSNLLDNALESAEHSIERKVSCEVCRKTQYMDFIVVQNSCDTAPLMRNGLPISDRLMEGHGYGTKIIQRKVKQYNGNMLYAYDEQNKQFSVSILLPRQSH